MMKASDQETEESAVKGTARGSEDRSPNAGTGRLKVPSVAT